MQKGFFADIFFLQVEELNEKNKRYATSLNKKDFFHEHEMLLKEVFPTCLFRAVFKNISLKNRSRD